jgi:general secretion pathway protein C
MLPARRHRLLVELGLLAIVAYLAGLGVRQAVLARLDAAPPAPPAVTRAGDAVGPLADYAVIAERDLFNVAHDAVAAEPRAAALRLWGIAFAGDEARAIIEDTATHTQALYRLGDRVGDGRLASIGWDRATVAFDGGEAVLEMAAEPAPPADAPPDADAAPAPEAGDRIRRTGENAWLVDRREIAGALGNPSGLLTQLRAVAEVRDGRPAGFRLFRIRADSLFARLGLHDGDVVERVNGTEVQDPAALLRFLERLGHEPRVALDIVRAEAPRTLVYDLR